jgi:hypothetical protein
VKIKRIIAALLCSVVLFACASCAAHSDEVFDLDFGIGEVNEADFEGQKLKYLFDPVMNWAVSASNDSFLGYTYNTVLADAAIKRVKEIEENHNCTLIIESRSGLHEYVKAPVFSGVYVADIVSGISDMIGDNCRAGLYVGMSEVSDIIDITDSSKWGELPFLETMFYNNDLYGLVPAAWPELTQINFGYPIVFNGTIFTANGLADPREYVETNTWNWNKFSEVVQSAHLEEGGEVKHYGFMASSAVLTEMFLFSNGSAPISLDEDGNPYFSMYENSGMKAIDACINFYQTYKDTCLHKAALRYNHDEIAQGFCREEASMAAVYTGYIYGRDAIVAQKVYNFGILPFPHGPDVPDDYVYGVIENIYSAFAMPLTTTNPRNTATIINELYAPLEGFEDRETVQEYMSYNYFFDERDADVFFRMYDNCVYNYFHWTNAGLLNNFLGQKSAIEFVSANESALNELIVNDCIPIVDSILSLYGEYNAYHN